MNLTQIEKKLKDLVEYHNPLEFIYDLLSAYNLPKATVTRLRKGNSDLSKNRSEVILKNKVFFKEELMMDLHESISILEKNHKHNERFLIVTDWKTFLAVDTKTKDKLDTDFKDLPKHYDFFLPWAGMEKTQHANENPADVKAAEKMAKLFDAIKQNNPDDSEEFVHSLNVFLSRLLFCFFAEDTNIFEENQFTNAISSHTQPDGSDLDDYLDKLFEVLNTPPGKRENLPSYLEAFPYVNGGLFKDNLKVPKFNRKARQSIVDSGELNWSDINPDIFGSMFQAVIDVGQRGSLGQHYTSVPNIMKVIEPLFLNELKEEFEKAKGNKKKLIELLERLKNIKIFDPACGSGNFLIIAYKELRRLEIEVLEELKQIQGVAGTISLDFGADYLSHISLNNFFGIELDDFAHEVAKLALWLAEHQMNQEFFKAIGKSNPTLPLKDAGQIQCGNAARLDWKKICLLNNKEEVYLLGNPPYLGSSLQNSSQKEDLSLVFENEKVKKYKSLDYISIWFVKGVNFLLNRKSKLGFVTTDSICQGQQVELLWPSIDQKKVEIFFAHTSFKWNNNAKNKAGVSVVIIGIQNISGGPKHLFFENKVLEVPNINYYLSPTKNIIVSKRSRPISNLPIMTYGNKAVYGEPLILSTKEKELMVNENSNSARYIKQLIGAKEFIDGRERYCIWVRDNEYDEAKKYPGLNTRFLKVAELRSESTDKGAIELAKYPYRFRDTNETKPNCNSIIIPLTTSERREYIPIGFSTESQILTNAVSVLYNTNIHLLGVLTSRMHLLWVKAVGGTLESRIRYSSSICYNTFPFPKLSKNQIEELEKSSLRIVVEREKHTEKSMAELYDPEKMPAGLLEAHQYNDEIVEKCYRMTPFTSDEVRLEYLFNLYGKMIEAEQSANTLFAKQKKTRKKK